MKKTDLKDHDKFFAAMKYTDVEKIRKRSAFINLTALIFMFILAILSIGVAFISTMKPTPVIAFDSEGKRMIFDGPEIINDETTYVRVYRFMKDFIEKFEGVSPDIEENLKDAYNSLTPKFRQILLDKSVHLEKIKFWKNKNFKTDFKMIRLKVVEGSFKVGSTLTVEGYGKMLFKNAVDYADEGVKKEDYVYFSALLIVTPVSLDLSPDGLFIEFYKAKSLSDFRSLRAYLLEHEKEYLLEDGGIK
jgi:hypothetical protein